MKSSAEGEAKEAEKEMEKQSSDQSGFCSTSGTGKMVVVGMRMDAQSRELLTWSLVKVAEPGDRVVALHILVGASDRSNRGGNLSSCSSLISLVNSFQSVLAVYEGFCNLKQIDLKLKVCRGSSLRKALVRETGNLPAANLIIGVAKNNRAVGSSTSVARYCASKLPRECAVMAVNNGKIVYQRETEPSFLCLSPSGWLPYPSRSRQLFRHRHLPLLHTRIASGESKSPRESDKNRMNEPYRSSNFSCISNSSQAESNRRSKKGRTLSLPCNIDRYEIYSPNLEDLSSRSSCCDEESATESPHGRSGFSGALTEEEEGSEKFMISTFQRALRLPVRQATVHPDRKPLKSLSNLRSSEQKPGKVHKDLKTLHLKYSSTCRLFSFREISTATSNFSSERLIGKGGSSRVYRARLLHDKEFAVKILKQSEEALRQFLLEVEIITTLHHKNIIPLFGFCFEGENLVLVYDFLARGSLEDNLHGAKLDFSWISSPVHLMLLMIDPGNEGVKASFGWAERLKVATGVAEALNYLHSGGKPVIHRDVKSSNILLSDDYEPRLADFGLAQYEDPSSSSSHSASFDVAGTFGYLAPEYFMYGKVDEKIDVYAFGVVLLELLTGKKPINAVSPKRQQSLVTWAKQFLVNNQARLLLDPSLGDQYDEREVERVILAASLCIRKAPISRPRMALVLKLLQGDEDIEKWAELQVSSSEERSGLEEEEEPNPGAAMRSHLSLALLDVDDETMSTSSVDHAVDFIMAHGSLENYFQSRDNR